MGREAAAEGAQRRGAATPLGLLGLALLAALLLPAGATAGPTDWTELRTLNIAHQGGEDEAPSNTMYAFDRAMALGSDMLELDIHATKDGKLAVIHDGTVDRTTDGSGSVYEMTMAEIQALDAGYWMVPGEGIDKDRPASDYPFRGVRTGEKSPPPGFSREDFRITSLPEVMRKYPDVPINIEIKGAGDEDVASYMRNAEILAAFLNRLGRTEGIVVASFNDAALARFHQLAPDIDTAPATGAAGGYVLAGVPPPEGTKVFQVPTSFSGITVVDPEFVDRAHRDGFGVHVWTINDAPTMNQLLDWDVDGIMTAEPMRLEKVLCQREAKRPALPGSSPGKHCTKAVSIACDVEATDLEVAGRRAEVTVVRRDDFEGRCAGVVALKGFGTKARRRARFNFGWTPPSDGGPGSRVVKVQLSDKLAGAIEREGRVRASAQPFGAFVSRAVLDAG